MKNFLDAEDNVDLPAKSAPIASKRKLEELQNEEGEKKGVKSKKRSDTQSDDEDAPLSKSTKPKPSKAKIMAENFESDEEMDEKPSKIVKNSRKSIESDDKSLKSIKSESKSKPKSNKSVKSSSNETKSTIRTLVVKGKAPVDPECRQKLGKAHVYYEGSAVYDCMLNQTNVQNNNNKYYIIQLLEDDKSKQYSVWQRWGRVGFAVSV